MLPRWLMDWISPSILSRSEFLFFFLVVSHSPPHFLIRWRAPPYPRREMEKRKNFVCVSYRVFACTAVTKSRLFIIIIIVIRSPKRAKQVQWASEIRTTEKKRRSKRRRKGKVSVGKMGRLSGSRVVAVMWNGPKRMESWIEENDDSDECGNGRVVRRVMWSFWENGSGYPRRRRNLALDYPPLK